MGRGTYKYCPKCERTLARSNFGTRNKKKYAKSWCRECEATWQQEYRAADPEKAKEMAREHDEKFRRSGNKHDYHLRSKYGLTLKDYERMLDQGGGGCWICGTEPTARRLHVDHDHKTGKVRGLLCWSCNSSIGRFKDNPELLMRAAAYLINAAGGEQ